ncbi:MAG: LysR family transcriptional regulator [Lachnospiraceae bacterium]|nr:LysR family transcriptional regulator [Lachnospiraceae bacterium]
MNITQLRFFITIAQLENVTKASDLLHVSQSSLSKTISALEKELGVELFKRNGRNITLNASGERFLESCKKIVSEMDGTVKELDEEAHGRSNTVRIGIEGGSGKLFACMEAFKRQNSNVAYDISCAIEETEHPDINDYDLMIYPEGRKYAKFNGIPFYRERFLLAAHSESELRNKGSATLADLNGRDYVFIRYGINSYEYPMEICDALAVQFNSVSYVDSRSMHREMIASGLAVGFIPESVMDIYKNDTKIRTLVLMNPKFTRQMMISFRREKHLSDTAAAFRRFALDYFGLEDNE